MTGMWDETEAMGTRQLNKLQRDPTPSTNRRLTMQKRAFWNTVASARGTVLMALLTAVSAGDALADRDDRDSALLPAPVIVSSTVPLNGDLNPYGVVFVPKDFARSGTLKAGDLLVSNFNNNQNLQGTGTTIVKIVPSGTPQVFFAGSAGLGLTTGLVALRSGFVIVGNMPSADGTSATVQPGSILVLNAQGARVAEWTSAQHPLVNGPWDMAVHDEGDRAKLFVSNVLGGTVVRFDLDIRNGNVTIGRAVQIASGYMHRGDPAALEVGPTGLVYDARRDRLYVASTADNTIFAIADAGTSSADVGRGTVVFQDNVHLHGPLALALGPNGHLFASNSDVINSDPAHPSEIVEFTTNGRFIAQLSVDPAQGGSFGLGFLRMSDDAVRFAAVDDNTATIMVWALPFEASH